MAESPMLRPMDKQQYLAQDEYPTIHVEGSQGNTLDFCGVMHGNNPDDPNEKYMLDRAKRELGDFLSKPSEHEKLVLLEGWKGPRTSMDELTEDQLVRAGGEEALADRMARQAGAEIASPEPPRDEEFDQLCQEFPSNQVFYWLVARQAVQWGREVPLAGADADERREAVQQKFDGLVKLLGDTLGHVPSFQEIGASFGVMAETHRELFASELDWNDLEHFNAHANPLDDNSVINDIMRRSNQIRDMHVAAEIKKAMDAGKDVFALYGDGHAYTLEPALRSLGTST